MSAWEVTNINYKQNLSTVKMMNAMHNSLDLFYIINLFVMWFIMMIAMMLPSAIPVILMFDKISNERKRLNYSYVKTFNFIIAYLLVWIFFSLIATTVHIILQLSTILNPMSLSVGYNMGALIFILAGIYQMTPLKEVCLHYCKNPIEIFGGKKIFDNLSVVSVGINHGFYCVGCCWVLMSLLFYGGIMNIFWIAGLSLYMIIEKCIIKEKFFNLFTGSILIVWGFAILYIYN
jgi:predicted metal-binding membrane protein